MTPTLGTTPERRDEIQAAQAVVDEHALDAVGRCLVCRTFGCPIRDDATRVFAQYGQLPKRHPQKQ